MADLSRFLFKHYMIASQAVRPPFLPGVDNGYRTIPQVKYHVVRAATKEKADAKLRKTLGEQVNITIHHEYLGVVGRIVHWIVQAKHIFTERAPVDFR